MADLGSIETYPHITRDHPAPKIDGVVFADGAAMRLALTRMYLRSTGEFINQSYSNGEGKFTIGSKRHIEGLPVFIVAIDMQNSEYNALIFDNIVPL